MAASEAADGRRNDAAAPESADAGSPDGGSPDGGSPDAGSPDAGSPDGGSPDAGSPDAGDPETAPIARVRGEPMLALPLDLYIPPDALEVFLDAFEGPLDLLLYLIKRQNIDILELPIAEITAQYMRYIAMMEILRLELAAEYLLMAAMLAEIKSRMLLPRVDEDLEDEDDPRAELIRRLQEYERIKSGAESLEELPRMERELHQLKVIAPVIEREQPQPDVSLQELLLAFRDVAERARLQGRHEISREALSVRERMSHVLSVLKLGGFCEFATCFEPEEGRGGVVVTFLAILELCKEASIDIVQAEPFGQIWLTPRGAPLPGDVATRGTASDESTVDRSVFEAAAAVDGEMPDDAVTTDGAAPDDALATDDVRVEPPE